MNISQYHRMVPPCLHISILMHTGVNHQSGQLKMPIPSIPGDRHSTRAADGRVGPTSNLQISSGSHLTSVLQKSLKQNLIFFFLKGMCILVYLSSLSSHEEVLVLAKHKYRNHKHTNNWGAMVDTDCALQSPQQTFPGMTEVVQDGLC